MFEKFKFWFILAIAGVILVYIIPVQNISGYFTYAFSTKTNLNINLSLVNPTVKTVAADPTNQLVMRAEVRDDLGKPVSKAHIVFSTSNNVGQVYPASIRTDRNGECLVSYIPPPRIVEQLGENQNVRITANINKTRVSSFVDITLTRTPIILVHGYQATGSAFDNMKGYFSQKGYLASAISYRSPEGIISSATELNGFIQQQKLQYLSKGIQVKRFDIIAHSMGGLVTRYYTCSDDYIKNNDVRKIIFISVPHRGSLWASIGAGYYNDLGIRDLIPDSEVLTRIFPTLLNKGLNNMIQVGSIIGQYDEVVSPESASLDEWNIKTEVFNVGENNFNVNSLLAGNILETANHATVLNNKKVFERIESMLISNLPYPSIKK